MNPTFVFALTVSVMMGVVCGNGDKYSDKYDNIDLDEILGNERLYKKYLECLLADDDKNCTPDGKELRMSLPDALTNGCAKCTEKQKSGSEKVIKHVREHNAADWELFVAKWDPKGLYMQKFPH